MMKTILQKIRVEFAILRKRRKRINHLHRFTAGRRRTTVKVFTLRKTQFYFTSAYLNNIITHLNQPTYISEKYTLS